MDVITSVHQMKIFSARARAMDKKIAFVPTMGFLHEGHLSLMREGKRRGDILVVSIFVNPTQFSPSEDFEKYPRDFAMDCRMAEGVGVDVLFAPEAREMYPPDHQTFIRVTEVTRGLCGKSRPTHFQGVATVVGMLFNIVMPHVALFGEKDFQQLVTIQQMVKDLHMDTEVLGMPIIREADGLAMSSRNSYLKPDDRKAAHSLHRSLKRAEELILRGERGVAVITEEVRRILQSEPLLRLDYVQICEPRTLQEIERIDGDAVVALAVYVGKVRLIDNFVYRVPRK
ncbi:MAG: pantoate--beta-alanine ligase [Deltaproteobacteria bacterium]